VGWLDCTGGILVVWKGDVACSAGVISKVLTSLLSLESLAWAYLLTFDLELSLGFFLVVLPLDN